MTTRMMRLFITDMRALIGAWLATVALTAILVGSIVWYVQDKRGMWLEANIIDSWQERLVQQGHAIDRINFQSGETAKVLALRLGAMQARLLRLEAFGTHVSNVAGMDPLKFGLDEPVALGGPQLGQYRRELNITHLVDEMEAELSNQENQLKLLEDLLRSRKRTKDSILAGRPVEKGWLSSKYGNRIDPFSGNLTTHHGVDFAGKAGWPVISVAAGVVTYVGPRTGYGLLVEINHGNGYMTRYGHHENIVVKLGDIVKARTLIATMGNTGRSTGPHVHYEILKDGTTLNPEKFIKTRRP